ncbi:MAG: molybdopterin-guanine dinucleotide biosynthesis protein B [Methanomicrobiales archaeon]
MKVINIIGHSCSGKTTFISKLVVKLKDLGRVATIKHLGHHNFNLEKGKDTTIFYESGVTLSAGIDSEKTVITIRNNDLTSILDLLADQGIEFTVIEGFKTLGLPAIVIGDLESDKVLFRNPTLDDIMNGLEQFPEYCTLNSVETELRKAGSYPEGFSKTCLSKPDQSPNGLLMTVSVPANFSETQFAAGYTAFRKIAEEVSGEISHEYHPVLVYVGLRNCWNFSLHAEFLIAVIAEDFETASFVFSAVHERIKRKTAIVG